MRFALALVLTSALAVSAPAQAPLGNDTRLYGGPGLGPGFGAVAIASDPVLILLTREAALYVDYVPPVVGGSGRILTSVGIGGSIRAWRTAGVLMDFEPGRYDLDTGVRIGPSFYTLFGEQTAESDAKAFRIMFDPFVRGAIRLGSSRVVFAELGFEAPALRAGLAVSIAPPTR
ncbi:MAG: hypothetical protein Rubg2KO_16970 [Rubricoccaceae bacterium]